MKSFKCQSNMSKKETLIAILLVIVIVFIWVGFITSSSTPSANDHPTKKQDTADCIDAYIMSHQYIEKILKSPSTAKFGVGKSNYECSEYKDNKFRINSHVDSQNDFGAMIRSEYTVDMKYLGDNKWNVIALKFDGKIINSIK